MAMTIEDLEGAIRRFHRLLDDNRDVLDALNVYQKADRDTGTNLVQTTRSVVEAFNQDGSNVWEAMEKASVDGAQGSSGAILAEVLGGLARVFSANGEATPTVVAQALRAASDGAYRTVSSPVEGTILTVMREAAEEAERLADTSGDLLSMLGGVYERACDALARTQSMLDVLAQAGVVDAGAAGATLLLASLLEASGHQSVVLPDVMFRKETPAAPNRRTPMSTGHRFEVMFLLSSTESRISEFRRAWSEFGEAVVIVGGGDVWSCHIHTDDIGGAIEAALAAGVPSQIRVSDLLHSVPLQSGESTFLADEPVPVLDFEPNDLARNARLGVVAVVAGDGLIERFRSLGVQGVIPGGLGIDPSIADMLAVVESVPAETVVVLPNDRRLVPVAEQLDGLTRKHVSVVPTRSIPQGIAAMYGYDPSSDDEGTFEDMAAAASSIVTGEMTLAVRNAEVLFGSINRGDWLGLADGTIVVADPDLESALRGLVATILPIGAETMTLYVGADAPKSATKALTSWLAELHPHLRIIEVKGDQPSYPFLVSVE